MYEGFLALFVGIILICIFFTLVISIPTHEECQVCIRDETEYPCKCVDVLDYKPDSRIALFGILGSIFFAYGFAEWLIN